MIAQQWQFTYRYPTYDGVETSHLVLPADKQIELHVTSLDAVHSFWAYDLGVKADATLGTDNVVYVNTRSPRSFDIHCAELCGLYHGYMFDTGKVVGERRLRRVDQAAAAGLPARRPVHAALQHDVLPRPAEEGRMRLRRLVGFNLLAAVVLAAAGYYLGWWLGHQISGKSLDYVGDTGQNDIALFLAYLLGVIGFLAGLGFLNYPFARIAGRPAIGRPRGDGGPPRLDALHRLLHRPQGGRPPVPDRDRLLHLLRRRQRDADPLRAPAAAAERLRVRAVPHPRRAARHDDDGDDDERDPRPVRELLPAADDRGAAPGLPAYRGAHLLAADGGRPDPQLDRLLRRLPDRLDGVRAAERPGEHGHGRLHRLLRPRRDLDDAARLQHAGDRVHDAGARAHLGQAADLRLEHRRDRRRSTSSPPRC